MIRKSGWREEISNIEQGMSNFEGKDYRFRVYFAIFGFRPRSSVKW